MAAVTVLSAFRAPKNKTCPSFHFFPFYLPHLHLDIVNPIVKPIYVATWETQNSLHKHLSVCKLVHMCVHVRVYVCNYDATYPKSLSVI